jgi:hypothetical protein
MSKKEKPSPERTGEGDAAPQPRVMLWNIREHMQKVCRVAATANHKPPPWGRTADGGVRGAGWGAKRLSPVK